MGKKIDFGSAIFDREDYFSLVATFTEVILEYRNNERLIFLSNPGIWTTAESITTVGTS